MKKKRIILTIWVVLVVLFVGGCSSQRGGMKKTRHKKCNCPTFSYIPSEYIIFSAHPTISLSASH
ncbi:MAG: hypothetical protein LBR17_00645 [Bacteroidales bacterium]|nr:hypothetical protein [Bacteroidales bacterium]